MYTSYTTLHYMYILYTTCTCLTLHVHVLLLQNRAKGASRRPPSRHGRKTTSQSDTLSPTTLTTTEPIPKDDFFDNLFSAPPTSTTKVPPQTKQKTDLFGNDDLFADDPLSQPSKSTKSSKDDDDLDGLFGTSKPSVKNPLEDDLFGEETDKPVKQEKPVKPVPQVTDDDLFGEPVKPKKPVKPVPQVTAVDDLFDEPVKPKKPVKPVPQVTAVDDLFDEPVKPKKPVKPVPQVTDDDLFDDIIKQDKPALLNNQPNKLPDNLFSVSPPPLQPTKTDDEDGDLFASLGPTPKPKKPSTPVVDKSLPTEAPPKKSVPKPSDTPSIFTDIPTIDQEITKPLDTGKRDDDIFASGPPGQKPPDTNVSRVRERERLNKCFISYKVDELFSEDKKSAAKKKTKGRPDEDLFGNTDDIFGDIPASKPKVTKTKKKKKTTTKTAEAKEEGGEGVATTETPPTQGKSL